MSDHLKEIADWITARWGNYGWGYTEHRYTLFTKHNLVEDDPAKTNGSVSEYIDFEISGNSIETLVKYWENDFFQRRFATTCAHFIYDRKDKKVVRVLSSCA